MSERARERKDSIFDEGFTLFEVIVGDIRHFSVSIEAVRCLQTRLFAQAHVSDCSSSGKCDKFPVKKGPRFQM